MTDKIAEIRARHAQSEKNYIELESTWKAQVHEDRGFLLTEVERLTRERDEARAEIERMREALQPFAAEAQRYDPDDGDDLHPAWDSRFQIKHLRAARKALEAKP